YLFSMNDLCGIDLIPQLREAGVTSLKIEGRMRSARYVEAVTAAYRMALDAPPDGAEILAAAGERLREAMGRRSTAGYFAAPQPAGIISPQHSGNIGLFLGKIETSRDRSVRLVLKEPLRCGDRLRLHQEKSGERLAFTLKTMHREGVEVDAAAAGATVTVELPEKSSPGDSLYKVDCCERRADEAKKGMVKPERFRQLATAPSIRQKAEQVLAALRAEGIRSLAGGGEAAAAAAGKGNRTLRWWLKVADFDLLRRTMPQPPERIVVTLTQQSLSQFKRGRRWLEPILDRLVWALPPIIAEETLPFYRRAIGELAQGGFGDWQIGHIGQVSLFQGEAGSGGKGKKNKRPPRRRRFTLSGDYTLNILNSLALRCASELGLGRAQCAIEGDRDNLRAMLAGGKGIEAGMTIYGAVPLFIARLKAGHFQYERPFLSPKGERFVLKEAWGQTVAVADPVFSLLGRQGELAAMGVRYGVVDISLLRMLKGELEQVAALAAGKGGKPPRQRSSTFNYLGSLD
ncbi:MAG: U32 family peptidase, partial [Desulfobulbaceae bacterium]|nr:U32 family peptidase [Desulfobulbaceae bacterium]